MNRRGLKILNRILAAAAVGLLLQPHALFACAACYGQSDSPMAKGMNWGIFSLLGVVVFVLGSLASFFVFLGKRAASVDAQPAAAPGDAPESKL